MTDPHKKATEDRRKAGEELMSAYDAVCEAADLYEPEENL